MTWIQSSCSIASDRSAFVGSLPRATQFALQTVTLATQGASQDTVGTSKLVLCSQLIWKCMRTLSGVAGFDLRAGAASSAEFVFDDVLDAGRTRAASAARCSEEEKKINKKLTARGAAFDGRKTTFPAQDMRVCPHAKSPDTAICVASQEAAAKKLHCSSVAYRSPCCVQPSRRCHRRPAHLSCPSCSSRSCSHTALQTNEQQHNQ